MTEEEIIDILENVYIFKNTSDKFTDLDLNAIQGLLDLYNKQKETIINQERIIMEQEKEINKYKNQEYGKLFNGRYISKDKIRKEIEETEKELYNGDILQRFAYIKIETLKDLLKE